MAARLLASLKLAHELRKIEVTEGQEPCEEDLHIVGAQERESVLLEVTLS